MVWPSFGLSGVLVGSYVTVMLDRRRIILTSLTTFFPPIGVAVEWSEFASCSKCPRFQISAFLREIFTRMPVGESEHFGCILN